jgi:hypothetical protein
VFWRRHAGTLRSVLLNRIDGALYGIRDILRRGLSAQARRRSLLRKATASRI